MTVGVKWYKGNRKIKNAQKVQREYNGQQLTFDSKLEAFFFDLLVSNNIDFELKPFFILQDAFKHKGLSYKAITYRADFRVGDDVIDVKGYPNDVFPLKKKMFIFKYGMRDGLNLIVLKNKKQMIEYVRGRLEEMRKGIS